MRRLKARTTGLAIRPCNSPPKACNNSRTSILNHSSEKHNLLESSWRDCLEASWKTMLVLLKGWKPYLRVSIRLMDRHWDQRAETHDLLEDSGRAFKSSWGKMLVPLTGWQPFLGEDVDVDVDDSYCCLM